MDRRTFTSMILGSGLTFGRDRITLPTDTNFVATKAFTVGSPDGDMAIPEGARVHWDGQILTYECQMKKINSGRGIENFGWIVPA